MNKQINLFLSILLLFSFASKAQPVSHKIQITKLSPQAKERLFGSRDELLVRYADMYRRASPDLKKRINEENIMANRVGQHSKYGVTSVSQIPFDKLAMHEYVRSLKNLTMPNKNHNEKLAQLSCYEILASPTQRILDMSDYGIITPVRNQGNCGSCWDFATVAGLETAVLLANGSLESDLNLSEEQLLSCTGANTPLFSNSCAGGNDADAAKYCTEHPIETAAVFSYNSNAPVQETNQCNIVDTRPTNYIASEWGYVQSPSVGSYIPSIEQIKWAICTYGSVVSPMTMDTLSRDLVDSVYIINNSPNFLGFPVTNHVIQIVGWNDDLQAWKVKNSWGSNWGDNGFFYVHYNTNNIGAFAIWLKARIYTNACPTGGQGVGDTSIHLIGASVDLRSFSNKDDNLHYWVYLHLGNSSSSIGTNADGANDSKGVTNGTQIPSTLGNINQSITFDQLKQGGNLQIDFHGNFGGFHQNSDWSTGVDLKIVWSDGSRTVISWPLNPIHADGSKPHTTWTGNFKWIGNSFMQVGFKLVSTP